MNELTIFKNDNFGEIRTIVIDDEPWFVLKDICEILELKNPTVVAERLDPDERSKFNLGRQGESIIINESGLYTAVLQSRKPESKKFRKWITSEVLPQIRKEGIYATTEVITKILNDPGCVIEVFSRLKCLQDKCQLLELSNKQNKQLIGELKPKATYYDLILQNKNTMPITKIAKDYGLSGQTFNSLLHELGIQYKMGDCWLIYQKYADQGYTQSKTHVVDAQRSVMHTQWTPKGRLFIYDLLKNKRNLLPMIERIERLEDDENE